MKFVLSMFMTPTRNILPIAVAAERAGFAMATLSEHVVSDQAGYDEADAKG